jgi:hypothetical protein
MQYSYAVSYLLVALGARLHLVSNAGDEPYAAALAPLYLYDCRVHRCAVHYSYKWTSGASANTGALCCMRT